MFKKWPFVLDKKVEFAVVIFINQMIYGFQKSHLEVVSRVIISCVFFDT